MHSQVIVIGAGLAGIKTALDLHNAGVTDVLILEATSRVGGRLKSIDASKSNKVKFDLGALWFHDGLNNPLYEKARKKGNIDFYHDDGKHIYFLEKENVIDSYRFLQVTEEIMTFACFYFEKTSADDISLKDLCMIYMQEYKNELSEDQKQYGVGAVRMWAELWHGAPWDQVSARYIFADSHLGRNILVKSGYINVFNNEYHELPQKFRNQNILLDCKVSKIDYTRLFIALTTTKGVFTCDHLVVTVPQTCLKEKNPLNSAYIEWAPRLPPQIERVLPEVYFGSLGKVIFEFDECFWPKDVDRFYGLSTRDVDSKTSEIASWDYPALFLNYQRFAGVPAIVVLTQSPLSAHIETLDEDAIWKLFLPLFAAISTGEVKKPHTIRRTEWNREPLLRGSYASVAIGSMDPLEIIAAFVEGIEGRIGFAGAETMDDSSNGCAHGAWFSGQREARRILNEMRKRKGKL